MRRSDLSFAFGCRFFVSVAMAVEVIFMERDESYVYFTVARASEFFGGKGHGSRQPGSWLLI
jgi:hypothetical protein